VLQKTPTRTPIKRLRRRSTLDWANASPSIRQRRLEEDARARMTDVFFSLHVEGEDDPIYVSESIMETMNPTFGTFSLVDQPAHITRQDSIMIKIWIKDEESKETSLHIQYEINMRYLEYIGKSLDTIRRPLPRNCVLFTLTDGLYTVPSTWDDLDSAPLSESTTSISNKVLPTSSYDALMRLSTLDVCIQDALATRLRVEAEINSILEENKSSTDAIRSVAPITLQLASYKSAVELEKRRLEAVRKRRDALRSNISSRESFMSHDLELQLQQTQSMHEEQPIIEAKRDDIRQITDTAHGQRRRIAEDILRIFPIEPIPGKALAFTIRGLALPNASDLDDTDEPTVSAALGHVAQVVHMLAAYLSKPLPYPLRPRGSTSTVVDQVSASTATSVYPLFSRGVARFRFEYGVFLLNKNIEILSNHVGLRVMDLRHTLPNLKYLLYITTAGTGDLPARKAGGMRAFLRAAKGDDSTQSSRRGSDASSVGGMVSRLLRKGKDGEVKSEQRDRSVGKTNGMPFGAPKLSVYKASQLREG
jgi:UV radiation resistance-associated gene protein